MQKLIILLLFLPMVLFSQNKLVVNVENVSHSNGKICVAVYSTSDSFLKFENVFEKSTSKAEKGITTISISDLPSGTYAFAVFHDENANGELDTNFFGIPKEPIGFSIGKMKTFGPPSFEECSFILNANKEIAVSLK